MNDHAKLRGKEMIGFAHLYLQRCKRESKLDDEIDIRLYTKLVQLDSKLGTTATEQLFCCISHSLKFDLIKVSNKLRVLQLK